MEAAAPWWGGSNTIQIFGGGKLTYDLSKDCKTAIVFPHEDGVTGAAAGTLHITGKAANVNFLQISKDFYGNITTEPGYALMKNENGQYVQIPASDLGTEPTVGGRTWINAILKAIPGVTFSVDGQDTVTYEYGEAAGTLRVGVTGIPENAAVEYELTVDDNASSLHTKYTIMLSGDKDGASFDLETSDILQALPATVSGHEHSCVCEVIYTVDGTTFSVTTAPIKIEVAKRRIALVVTTRSGDPITKTYDGRTGLDIGVDSNAWVDDHLDIYAVDPDTNVRIAELGFKVGAPLSEYGIGWTGDVSFNSPNVAEAATLTITGVELAGGGKALNYTFAEGENGTKSIPAAIEPLVVTQDNAHLFTLTIDGSAVFLTYYYTGDPIVPAHRPAEIVCEGIAALQRDYDYQVIYENNVDVGVATARAVEGPSGNFKIADGVSLTRNFGIISGNISVQPKSYTVTAGSAPPVLELEFTGVSEDVIREITARHVPTFVVTDASGGEVALADAVRTVGTYTITWKYTDAELIELTSGNLVWNITDTATLTVTPPPSDDDTPSYEDDSDDDHTPSTPPSTPPVAQPKIEETVAPVVQPETDEGGDTPPGVQPKNNESGGGTRPYENDDDHTPSTLSGVWPETDQSGGWDEIEDELRDLTDRLDKGDAKPGETVTVTMNGAAEVPKEVLREIAGKDVNVEFDMGGGVIWKVNGQDIPQGIGDLDLGIKTDSNSISVTVMNSITGEIETMQLELSHSGPFGATLYLTLDVGRENRGYWANLYYFDETIKELVFQYASRIDADGKASWPFDHASSYAVVIDEENHDPDIDKTNPDTDGGNPFTDVKETDWFYEDVLFVFHEGLMPGTSDTTFHPDGTLTRGRMAAILWGMEGSPVPSGQNPFTDVSADEDYTDAVIWTNEQGIFEGYGNKKFYPEAPITRQQLAAIFYRYAAFKGYDLTPADSLDRFTDTAEIEDEALDAVKWAVGSDLMFGTTDTAFGPKDTAARAQIAAMLHRFIEKYGLEKRETDTGLMGWADPTRDYLNQPTKSSSSHAGHWAGLALIAAAGIGAAILVFRRKRR